MRDCFATCLEALVFLCLLPILLLCMGIGVVVVCTSRALGIHGRLFGQNVVLVDVINGLVARSKMVPDWAYLILVFFVVSFFVCLVLPFVILTNGLLLPLTQRQFQVAKDVARVIGSPGERGY